MNIWSCCAVSRTGWNQSLLPIKIERKWLNILPRISLLNASYCNHSHGLNPLYLLCYFSILSSFLQKSGHQETQGRGCCSLPLWRVHEIKRMYLVPRTHGLFIT
jgi:hypothetical protein